MINEKTLNILEYNKILSLVASKAFSSPTKEYIMSLKPETDLEKVNYLLDLTSEADYILFELSSTISLAYDDILSSVEIAEKGGVLSCEQLLKVARLLKVSRNAKKTIQSVPEDKTPLLKDKANKIYSDSSLESRINECIESENEVSSNASEKLRNIRNQITQCNRKIKEKLNSFLTNKTYSQHLQDGIVTMRNNRYVLPVKTSDKSLVQGLIHDQSATGSTTFIEPIAVVEMNNELRSLEIDEQVEIEAILRSLSFAVSNANYEIKTSFETIKELDCIFAKAQYARAIKAYRPIVNNTGFVNIINGRHPLIDASKVVPVTISVGGKYSTLLISGPNTGGKTVSIKMVGIFSLMCMTGLFVPANIDSTLSVFDNVLCEIGDSQSIESNLSTFSSHLNDLIKITNEANDKCLILLDELGSGTDPSEGAALAIAILKFLMNKKAKTIVTSHYKELKEFAYSTENINISGMDFDPETFKPTYRLIMGQTASSNALEIAGVLGLNPSIVSQAKALIKDEDNQFNNIIRGAEISRREAQTYKDKAENEYKKAQEIAENYQKLLREVEDKKAKLEEKLAKSAKDVLGDYLDEAEELLDELKEKVKQGDEKALFEARTIRKKLENMNVESHEKIHYEKINGEILKGDTVYVKSLNKLAQVVSISSQKQECTVKIGFIESRVKLKDLQKVKTENEINKNKENKVRVRQLYDLSLNITTELKLIGKNCDEALIELETYLSNAYAKGYNEVRIVHGKGTGVLRKAVQDYLKTSPYVESYRIGQYGEGDNGVTIVTLKKS